MRKKMEHDVEIAIVLVVNRDQGLAKLWVTFWGSLE